MFGLLAILVHSSGNYSLKQFKNKTVGDGQHGTARFATKGELKQIYKHVKFEPKKWRQGINCPKHQGLLLASLGKKNNLTALVDTDDVHCLMLGAAGIGKTAYFLYPNLEYACATGMSFICTDTKGDVYRNYGTICAEEYGYNVAVIDLRNPTRSHGINMLYLVNKYMDIYQMDGSNISAQAKAEKFAKIIAKTIIYSDGADASSYGQNAFFYDAAEGMLTAAILLVAECCPKTKRHIISVYKFIQDMMGPSPIKGKSQFALLIDKLPPEHKARWFAGAAANSAEQPMQSVMSTALSRLNAFIDTELEQILCFDTAIDTEKFCVEKSAIFIVLPEEDNTKHFLVSLIIQQFYREILAIADENGGKLENRVMMYLDEFGTIPKIQSAEMMFSSIRSRKVSIVALIQSFSQLDKNYGKEGAEIIIDNCQDMISGGFAPNSRSAKEVSEALGTQTVLSGSISRGAKDPSQSLQMMSRQLVTPDELKTMTRGNFIVSKTGVNPMRSKLHIFFDWGIEFKHDYVIDERMYRKVEYADKLEIEQKILEKYSYQFRDSVPDDVMGSIITQAKNPLLKKSKGEVKTD